MESADEPTAPATEEAHALLGNECRITILLAIQDRFLDGEYPAAFSSIREAAGVEVSSQFSYHLQRLVGHYVRKGEGSYTLTYAGWDAVTTVRAGVRRQDVAFETATDATRCGRCGAGTVVVRYEHTWLFVECPDCDAEIAAGAVPPRAVADRGVAEVLAVFDRRIRHGHEMAARGACPTCYGRTTVETFPDRDASPHDVPFFYRCRRCADRLFSNPGVALAQRPAVRSHCRDRGVDVATRWFWELPLAAGDPFEVVGTEPWRCRAEFAANGADLAVTLDDDLRALDVTG